MMSTWVAGSYSGDYCGGGMAAHWDGSKWTLHHKGLPGEVTAIDGASPNSVYAADGCCIEHFDSQRWTRVFRMPVDSGAWSGMVALSNHNVWATGDAPFTRFSPFVAHFNGEHWITITSPLHPPRTWSPTGIAASSSSDVWVAGFSGIPGGTPVANPAIFHHGSTGWVANQPARHQTLHLVLGIAEHGPTDVWAVGYRHHDPLILGRNYFTHWDGHEWSEYSGPNAGPGSNTLLGIAAIPGTRHGYWAVGSRLDEATFAEQTAIYRH
jgi:hypothetical protein